jgi:PAS domain S-box-containing protein
VTASQTSRSNGDWRGIGRKLPLLTTALVAAAVLVLAAIAYSQMKRILVAAAGDRVLGVSQQVAAAFVSQNDRLMRDGSPLSHDSTLRIALMRGDSASLAAAQSRMGRDLQGTSQVVAVELWRRQGSRLLTVGRLTTDLPDFRAANGASVSPVGPLTLAHDTVLNEVDLPVLGASRDTLGYVRELSRVSSAQSKQLLQGLIGGNAVLFIGNASGDIWTDLDGRVDAPPAGRKPGVTTRAKSSDGSQWIGAITPAARTPWLIWVALPESAVTVQMRSFMLSIALESLLVIVLSALGASRLSRHIIAPLADVTHAAERIAGGDYAVRAAVVRRDEVGRLANSFNEMAEAVQIASVDLEEQQVELETQQAELEEMNEKLLEQVEEATRSREAAERARARAAGVVNGASAAVITTDGAGTIAEFNPAAQRMFGLAAAAAIGRQISDLVPALRGTTGECDLAKFIAQRSPASGGAVDEVTAVRADGTAFPSDIAVTRVPVDGAPLYTSFVRDLTERKQLEAQLHHAQKMDAVGRLAGGVAHDFNNILTVIVSYSDLILADDSVGTQVREDLEKVRDAADRATALTRQLLAFSRKQVMHPAVLDLSEVVGGVVSMLTRVIPTNIRLESKLGQPVDPVCVDRGQIEQVLMNLAVNARDAMPAGGALIIETANEMLDDTYLALHTGGAPGPHVVLSVRDTGAGMSPEVRDRIFEPFFTTKGPGQGTGLGLATVYGIVQQSGGSIYVYSEPGQGSIFKVYFPRHAGEYDVAEQVAAAPAIANQPATILLVEDDETVRDATGVVLRHLGHRVVSVGDVAAALNVIRAGAEQLDLVLTDAVMPGQSGLDLVEIVADERPDLPVIVMSGYSEEAVTGGRVLAHEVVFVEKPFTGPSIARAIATVRSARRERQSI